MENAIQRLMIIVITRGRTNVGSKNERFERTAFPNLLGKIPKPVPEKSEFLLERVDDSLVKNRLTRRDL